MKDSNGRDVVRAKSYTSIYDMFGPSPFNNFLCRNPNKPRADTTVFRAKCGDGFVDIKDHYVTSERFHILNKNSSRSVVRSSSTIFYDLDEIARRQSFTCYVELSVSKDNLKQKHKRNANEYLAQSHIVQECATQMTPKLIVRDSIEMNSKRGKNKFPNDAALSSEIFLRDNDYEDYKNSMNSNKCFETADRHQKFWSYAKYRTEYTKPVSEEKKRKKKDHGKRTEDPCPCQLFSYVCPCTDNKKSLSELLKNSKSTEQVDQSCLYPEEKKQENIKSKSHKNNAPREHKLTCTSFANQKPETNIPEPQPEPVVQVINPEPVIVERVKSDKLNPKNTKLKSGKKVRKVICPNCKEKVEVVSSTEDDVRNTVDYQKTEITSAAAYTYTPRNIAKPEKKTTDEGEYCSHTPQCEMIPVCQVLPEGFNNTKPVKKTVTKTSPRVIRITKACRHHPPCTVVPSCQRANVLKNNCEYIPPCLHRPRCVNLPLCVPISKTFNLDDFSTNQADHPNDNITECSHVPRCKYVPACQQESVENSVNLQPNLIPQVRNPTEYANVFNYQAKVASPTSKGNPNMICASCFASSPKNFLCKSTKSCQYEYSDYKSGSAIKESMSDAIVFIRDVGCQFRNKSPRSSIIRSQTPSDSFDFIDVKKGNYYTGIHTLRYEDKCTNPDSRVSLYMSSGTLTSSEIDSNCPSHGHHAQILRQTGFAPKTTSSFVAAYSTYDDINNMSPGYKYANQISQNLIPLKSKMSVQKGKYKKIFAVKRRRKMKTSRHHLVNCCSRKIFCQKQVEVSQ